MFFLQSQQRKSHIEDSQPSNRELQLFNGLWVHFVYLSDLNTNLFLVKDGTVAPMLKTPLLSSLIPPIEPYIKDLKFRFNATGRVCVLT